MLVATITLLAPAPDLPAQADQIAQSRSQALKSCACLVAFSHRLKMVK
jgi:hypothetical protein